MRAEELRTLTSRAGTGVHAAGEKEKNGMGTKEEYEATKQGKLNEQQERQRFENLQKATFLAALNGVYSWLVGRASINIIDIQQPPLNGLPAVTGKSIRFQLDRVAVKPEEEQQS